MGYFIHAEGINHLYSSSARGGWEHSPALSSGHTVCPGGLQPAASSPSALAPLPGSGETLNYSLENCSASPRITACMVLSPQKSNQAPRLETKKGVPLSLFFGQVVKWGKLTLPSLGVRDPKYPSCPWDMAEPKGPVEL